MSPTDSLTELYIRHAVAAFAKQHVLSFFNGKYLLPLIKQPQAQIHAPSGSLKFANGFTAAAQYIGRLDADHLWHWA